MEAEAIVLDTTEHGESDLIITFFSQKTGRLSAIAKGAKRSKKRFVNKLEIFTFLQISYEQKNNRSLAFLNEAELHNVFPNLRTHFEQYLAASIVREFLLLGIKDSEPEEKIFRLSLWALHNLNKGFPPKPILALFLIHYFGHIGYRPDLESCGFCENRISKRMRYSFDSASGRLVCGSCSGYKRYGMEISHGTIKLLHTAQNLPLERLHRVKATGPILKEALTLLHNFGRQIFQRDIVSWRLLHHPYPGKRENKPG